MKFNAVAEWWEEYIACVNPLPLCYLDVETENRYEALKKQIYQLEKQQAGLRESYHDLEANESTSLIGSSHPSSPDRLFIPLLDRELDGREVGVGEDHVGGELCDVGAAPHCYADVGLLECGRVVHAVSRLPQIVSIFASLHLGSQKE